MLEIHGDVIAPYVRGHRDYWSRIKLTNQVARRNSIKIRHDDIHQHQVVLGAGIHLVDSF